MYKPFFILIFLSFFILLASCAPVNNIVKEKLSKTDAGLQNDTALKSTTKKAIIKLEEKSQNNKFPFTFSDENFQNNITIILSKKDKPEIVNQFINIIELAVYQKK